METDKVFIIKINIHFSSFSNWKFLIIYRSTSVQVCTVMYSLEERPITWTQFSCSRKEEIQQTIINLIFTELRCLSSFFQKVLMSEIFDIPSDNLLESVRRINSSNQFDKCLDYKCATKLIPSWVRKKLDIWNHLQFPLSILCL